MDLTSDTDPPPAPCDGSLEVASLISSEELQLLEKLEKANRMLEADGKSLNSISACHSRKGSNASQISIASGTSHDRNEETAETDQWKIWGKLVNDWEAQLVKRHQYIRDMVRKGIPHPFRGISWQLLCGADKSQEKLLYPEYIKLSSAYEKVIRRDIARTYPEHEFFKEKDGLGQESLFNVMKAYSLHDREVGYCQGSAFIVGILLMQMPEEECFAVLVKIMQQHKMRDMYKPTMALLSLCVYQLENLIQEHMPELIFHFETQHFLTTTYASSWFLTLFTSNFNLAVSCRIIDNFLLDGIDIIFQVALALLTIAKDDLLGLDMEEMLKYFHKDLPSRIETDPDQLMNLSYTIKINQKKMKKWEKEYNVKKQKEQEEQGELKRLRNENRALRSMIDHLEVESASLAETLVRWQVERANGAETEYALAQQLADAQRRLETALLAQKEHDQECSRSNSLEGPTLKENLMQRDELIECLQSELVKVKLSEAENLALIRDQKNQIFFFEQERKSLRNLNVDNSVAHLQEELIALKLREAEANLSLKDMRQRFGELSESWKKHMESRGEGSSQQGSETSSSTNKYFKLWENKSSEIKKEEDIITNRIRDMETLTEMEALRLRVMELETQFTIANNQFRRQEEEKKNLKDEIEKLQQHGKDMYRKMKEQEHKYSDFESKSKYDVMMSNIKRVEDSQHIAELEQKISVLHLKNQELITEGEIRTNLGVSDRERLLQDELAELKAEVIRLRAFRAKVLGKTVSPIPDEED